MTDEMEILAGAPHEFGDDERTAFDKLVRKAGEVSGDVLEGNIRNAKALVVGVYRGCVQGTAALKRPQASYRTRIGGKTGVDIADDKYPYELGYVVLAPEMRGRGLSHQLVSKALEYASRKGVFATTRIDNVPMLATLARAGFSPARKDYAGHETRVIRLLVRAPSGNAPKEYPFPGAGGEKGAAVS